MQLVDVYPTLLEVAGVDAPADTMLDGESLLPLFKRSGQLEREALYWHFPAYLQGYTERHGAFRTTPAGAIRQGDYKLIEFFEDGTLELYNLAEDIGETENLAERMPEKTAELHERMNDWRAQVAAPVPREPNPLYDPAANR